MNVYENHKLIIFCCMYGSMGMHLNINNHISINLFITTNPILFHINQQRNSND